MTLRFRGNDKGIITGTFSGKRSRLIQGLLYTKDCTSSDSYPIQRIFTTIFLSHDHQVPLYT
jgi:hypothetical protein